MTTKTAIITLWGAKRLSEYATQVKFCLAETPPRKTIEFETLAQMQEQVRSFVAEVGFKGNFENGICTGIHLVKGTRKPNGFDAARKYVEYFWPKEVAA